MYPCMPHIHAIYIPLMFELDSARFEFTLKMRLNRKMLKRPNIGYIFEKLNVQGCQIYLIIYDIPMCPYHSTRPQLIQLVPTMQEKLFTLSFLKISFTKVAGTSIKVQIYMESKSNTPCQWIFSLGKPSLMI